MERITRAEHSDAVTGPVPTTLHSDPVGERGRTGRMPGLLVPLKVTVARALCHPRVGQVVRTVFGRNIPSRGCWIGVDTVPAYDAVRASLLWGFYESAEIRFVKRFLPQNLDIVELGSSIGVVASHAARKMNANRRIVCVEANRALLDMISHNVARNAPHVRATVMHGAVSYDGGELVPFAVSARNTDSAIASSISRIRAEWVPALTLREILAEHGFDEYALVSDIEGAEVGVIRRDASSLRRCRMMVIELHPTEFEGQRVDTESMRVEIETLGFRLIAHHGSVYAFERYPAAAEDGKR